MALKRLHKTSISEEVCEQLKQQIIDREWVPGEKLPSENELAVEMGVSRVTIRQALQKLTVLGLIETRVGEGSFVADFDLGIPLKSVLLPAVLTRMHSTEEVLDFRCAIETGTAALAARMATPEDIAELKGLIELQKRLVGIDISAFTKAGQKFHRKIAEMTNNSLIIVVNQIMAEIVENSSIDTISTIGYSGIPTHERLVDALEAHDEDKAIEIMRHHTMSSKEEYLDKKSKKNNS